MATDVGLVCNGDEVSPEPMAIPVGVAKVLSPSVGKDGDLPVGVVTALLSRFVKLILRRSGEGGVTVLTVFSLVRAVLLSAVFLPDERSLLLAFTF